MVLYPNKLPESERVCSGICTLNVLTQQLNMLAFTTSSREKVCTSALKKQLDTQIREHRTYFIGCRDFDALMSQL